MQLNAFVALSLLASANSVLGRVLPSESDEDIYHPLASRSLHELHARALPGQLDEQQLLDVGLDPPPPRVSGTAQETNNIRSYYDEFMRLEQVYEDIEKKQKGNEAEGIETKKKETSFLFYSGKLKTPDEITDRFIGEFKAGEHRDGPEALNKPKEDKEQEVITLGITYKKILNNEALRAREKKVTKALGLKSGRLEAIMVAWRWAQRVAEVGGTVIFVTPGAYNRGIRDTPNPEISTMWSDFQAYELTKPGSKVEAIIRYDADDLSKAPTTLWEQGYAPIGNPPDFRDWENRERQGKKLSLKKIFPGWGSDKQSSNKPTPSPQSSSRSPGSPYP